MVNHRRVALRELLSSTVPVSRFSMVTILIIPAVILFSHGIHNLERMTEPCKFIWGDSIQYK
jgi:hypothetical protein